MKKYFKLLRVHHYLKNFLIFIPLVFSCQIFEWKLSIATLLGFLAFSLGTSFVYIINDIRDVESDKQHPVKCKRPIASEEVTINKAYALSIICVSLALSIHLIIEGNQIGSIALLILYIIINMLYSFGLKNVPIVDVSIIVAGFMIRVFYGAAILHIPVSEWLWLTITFMSFYLALGKRRNELERRGDVGRKVLGLYSHSFLDKNMYMCLGLTIVCYALWCVDLNSRSFNPNTYMIGTVPVALLICMKYSLNIEKGDYGDPVDIVLGDKGLQGLISLYGIGVLGILYGNQLINYFNR